MDPRERQGDQIEGVRMALDERQSQLSVAIPGIVEAYNADAGTVDVNVAIQRQTRDSRTGVWTNVTISKLVDCPVTWPGGGGWTLTFPLAQNDEVLIVFADRAIDAWFESGGIQPQAEVRFNDLSDGIVIPKIRSKPNALNPAASTTTAQLRSDDGTCYIELAADGKVNIVSPSDVTITGNLKVTGTITALSGTGNDVGLTTHVHTGVQSGGSNSGPPKEPS